MDIGAPPSLSALTSLHLSFLHLPHFCFLDPIATFGAKCGLILLSTFIRKHLAHVITSSASLERQRVSTYLCVA